MARFIRKKGDYVAVDNRILQDPTLSFKAKGVYVMIMDLPGDGFTVSDLLLHAKEGPEVIAAAIKELVDAGHVESTDESEGNL